MGGPFSPRAGKAGPWRSVQEALRQSHEQASRMIDEAIASRKARGVPTDDRVDWLEEVRALLVEAQPLRDRAEVRDLLERAHAIANGGLQPLPPFVPDPGLEGVHVRLRSLSRADVLEMRGDLAAAGRGGEGAAAFRTQAAAHRAIRPFLAKCLVGVRGVELEDGPLDVDDLAPDGEMMGDVLDALDEAGLLGVFFAVARDYMDLAPLLKRGFGLPPPSTSPPSTAALAPAPAAAPSGATAAPQPSTSAAPSGRPIDARSATSSTMTTMAVQYAPPSVFTDS